MFKFFKKLFRQNPRKKGRRLAMGAMLAFRNDRDVEKFQKVRNQMALIVQRQTIFTIESIRAFQNELAEELNVNPILFGMIFSEIISYVDPDEPEGQKELFLFLRGIVDAIDIVYPPSF